MVQMTSTIQCKTRTVSGKGEAHKLRAAGLAPGVLYGSGTKPQLIAVDPRILGLQRKQYGSSFIYDVEVEGQGKLKGLLKEVQLDPVTYDILHVDLYAVDMSKPIRVEIPIELIGKPVGTAEGGVLSQLMRKIEVQCLPDKIPPKLTADVSELKIGQVLFSKAFTLPAGVVFTSRRDEPIATVIVPQEEVVATPEVTLEPGAEGAVPAEGAPAEGAAPAAEGAAPAADAKGKGAAPAADAKGKGAAPAADAKGQAAAPAAEAKGKKK
jgi:large subunit ribosomal protein L25